MTEEGAAGFVLGLGLGAVALAAAWKLVVRPRLLAQIAPQVQTEMGRLRPELGFAAQAAGVPAVAQAIGEAVRVVLERELP